MMEQDLPDLPMKQDPPLEQSKPAPLGQSSHGKESS